MRQLSLITLTSVTIAASLNIECEYAIFDSRYACGDKYRCLVKNDIDIVLPEEAEIKSITGTHQSGKTDESDIHFHISSKSLQYFPRGMEKFYKNLVGIFIWYTQLKEVHQEDLKPFPRLNNFYMSKNDIEVIEDGLFDYNPDLEVVIFENSKIFHIGPTVFSHLVKLKTLYFYTNTCTNLNVIDNPAGVLNVIKGVRSSCISPEFVNLKKKLKNLEKMAGNSVIVNSQQYSQNVLNFQAEFEDSKLANFSPLKQRFQKFIDEGIKLTNDDTCSSGNQQNILNAVDAKIEDLESRMTKKMEELLDEKLKKVTENAEKILNML